ncbi:MATE family efflux transporter [Candidatus Sororendozoicomonas aggregata]|uniref:MATE family efflux transporter n=1 Tax=Candidatus Sororendozoicomonas aggregata TaxID=3073239 RepID=UPI002ED4ADC0
MFRQSVYQRVWQFAWPAIISNLSVPLLGLVDSAVLGHLPAAQYLGGVAVSATVFNFLFWAFGFLRMGTTGLVAQEKGRGNSDALRKCLLQSVIVAWVVGFALMVCSPLILQWVLPWFNASAQVLEQARIYYIIRILSAPAVLCNYVLVGWLLGMQKPRGPLVMLVVSNGINILLDLLFVLGLGLATKGAALATVIADYVSLLIGLLLVARSLEPVAGHFSRAMLRDIRAFKRLLLLNRHLFVRTICLLFTQAFFTAQGARQGDDILAANALLLNFLLLISSGLDGFSHATEAMAGEALGQKRVDRFRMVVKATGLCSLVCAIGFMLAFGFGGGVILHVMTDIALVKEQANRYLPWLALMPLVAVWCYWLDGVFIAAIQTRMMQHTMLVATIGVFLPVWYVSQPLGNNGLWLAFIVFMAARGAGLILVYRWLDHRQLWLAPGQCQER